MLTIVVRQTTKPASRTKLGGSSNKHQTKRNEALFRLQAVHSISSEDAVPNRADKKGQQHEQKHSKRFRRGTRIHFEVLVRSVHGESGARNKGFVGSSTASSS